MSNANDTRMSPMGTAKSIGYKDIAMFGKFGAEIGYRLSAWLKFFTSFGNAFSFFLRVKSYIFEENNGASS